MYNLTNVTNVTNINELHVALNVVSGGLLIIAELVILFILLLIATRHQGGIQSLVVSSFGICFIVMLYWASGLAPIEYIGLPIGLFGLSLLYMMGNR
jgi:hypothetical protein